MPFNSESIPATQMITKVRGQPVSNPSYAASQKSNVTDSVTVTSSSPPSQMTLYSSHLKHAKLRDIIEEILLHEFSVELRKSRKQDC